MATTTKSKTSSAKPKTAKKSTKPAVTAKSKTASKTVAKKSVAKKPAATKKAPVKTAKSTKVVAAKPVTAKAKVADKKAAPIKTAAVLTIAKVRKWHFVSAVVFAALAAATYFVAKASDVSLTLSHATKDALTGKVTPAEHVVATYDVRYLLIAVLVVSAGFSLLRATRLKVREEKGIAAGVLPVRWIDFGVTFAALVAIVALLAGVQNLIAVKLLGLTIAVSYFFAWLAEREATGRKLFGIVGALTGLVAWLFIAATLIATEVYGNVQYGWFVYAAAGTLLVAQLIIAKLQKRAAVRNYLSLERDYVLVSLLAKLAVAAILIVGLRG